MIPLGCMAKRVSAGEKLFPAGNIQDIFSFSGCISVPFADYIGYWKDNGYELFDSPDIIRALSEREKIELLGVRFFYYEAHQQEYDRASKTWSDWSPDPNATRVIVPEMKSLRGYDVISFHEHTVPQHSPLSCNGLASELPVNEHCLFRSLEEAKAFLEEGRFDASEPGSFRIVAVYTFTDER
ncbi:MAG: hypothetical protein ACHQ2Z_11025 [Elusimicrobiota bacterium]